jgi:hypothetical protein
MSVPFRPDKDQMNAMMDHKKKKSQDIMQQYRFKPP